MEARVTGVPASLGWAGLEKAQLASKAEKTQPWVLASWGWLESG